jgi:hypothetical protein
MGARDLNEFFVCDPRLDDGLNVNPKASSYLVCLIADLLAQRFVKASLIACSHEFCTQFVNDMKELQRQAQPFGYGRGRHCGLSGIFGKISSAEDRHNFPFIRSRFDPLEIHM